MSSNFPPELIEQTLDCLEESQDYANCSLLCRHWNPNAQARLFRIVTLGAGIDGGRPDGLVEMLHLESTVNTFLAFDNLLHGSPHLGSYVRILNVGIRGHTSPLTQRWKEMEDAVARIMPLLLNLRTLGLFPCAPLAGSPIHIPDKLRYAFAGFNLNALQLSGWCLADPSSLIAIGHILPSSLHFFHCNFDAPFTSGLSVQSDLPMLANQLVNLELNLCNYLDVFVSNWVSRRGSLKIHTLTVHLLYNGSVMTSTTIRALYSIAPLITAKLCIIFEEGM
ncbi:hypothetical protein R3P38DRAFT_3245862 [Favolaschia claudopus]|uniref:F-box domain-containing protein n=1 Tax=Favolaschia claudopus TaxID=2862362 RepID=A0AAV9Z0A4_9AGAR